MFAVGGAGAQREIGASILKSLRGKIRHRKIKLILVAGTKAWVRDFFIDRATILGLKESLEDKYVDILFEQDVHKYFDKFNLALRKTDILWTKPSKLSFYTGLGLPIIIAPPLGSQEDFNEGWLLQLGSAMAQENVSYCDQWIFDLVREGWFAEAAMQGFVEAEKKGVFNIKKIVFKGD